MISEASHQLMQRLAANTRVGYSFEQEFYGAQVGLDLVDDV